MSEQQRKQEEQEQLMKEELAQQILLNEFEKNQMGVLSKTKSVRGKLTTDIALPDSPLPSSANGATSESMNLDYHRFRSLAMKLLFGSDTLTRHFLNLCVLLSLDSKKRPFELDTAEIERLSKQERVDVAKAIEEEVRISIPGLWNSNAYVIQRNVVN